MRKSDNKNHADIDAAIATEHICLAAAEQGLGSCWVCNFDPDMLKDNLHLSPNMYPVAIIRLLMNFLEPLKQRYSARNRKDITEIVSIL